MADGPWADRVLTEGQIAQALRHKGCTEIQKLADGRWSWRAPSGQIFYVTAGDVDAGYLERVIEKSRNGRMKFEDAMNSVHRLEYGICAGSCPNIRFRRCRRVLTQMKLL